MLCVLQIHDEELRKEVLSFCPLPQLEVDGKIFLPIDKCKHLMDNVLSLVVELKDLEKLPSEFMDNDVELAKRRKRDTKLGDQMNWSKVIKVHNCDECKTPQCFIFVPVQIDCSNDGVVRHGNAAVCSFPKRQPQANILRYLQTIDHVKPF